MIRETKKDMAPAEMIGALASTFLQALAARDASDSVLETGLARVVQLGIATGAGLYEQAGRQLVRCGWSGGEPAESVEVMIGEALDTGAMVSSAGKLAIRLPESGSSGVPRVLVLHEPRPDWVADRATASTFLVGLSEVFAHGLATQQRLVRQRRRGERLEAMMEIAAEWSAEDNLDALLEAMAEAAARLFDAERASIFLHDRARGVLVGRPALGVEGNRLEVADREGVVGAVLQHGEPRRWHRGDDREEEVNRSIDTRLQFVTHSLLAVPLWPVGQMGARTSGAAGQDGGRGKKPMGVFELINRRSGRFVEEEEADLAELAHQAAAAIQSTQTKERLTATQDRLVDRAAESAQLIGEHPRMQAVRESIARVATTDLSVLVLGENGTGKEVLAQSIHFQSGRRHEPFVAVNCAALVESLLESELFGHEKGAFTDAHQMRAGKFELASGGTLFLDEIGDLSPGGQAKLLRALEERTVVRVGGSVPIPVDVRVIAATNQPLEQMVRDKTFREDLFFRLNVVTLELPPLRERGGDIVLLAEYFLDQFAHQVGRKRPQWSESAKAALRIHDWPGNIRELRNLVERVAYLCPQAVIEASDLELRGGRSERPSNVGETDTIDKSLTLQEATRRFQAGYIGHAIDACQGNISAASEQLGVQRSNLYRKLKQLGVQRSSLPGGND